jgi:hypothetical protein
MLHAALAGFILTLIYKLLDKRYSKNDVHHVEIDWYMGIAVVITSSLAITLTAILVSSFQLPGFVSLISYAFYILIPFSIFKFMLDYKVKTAIIYSLWVPFVAILSEVPFVLLNGGTD